MTSQQKSQEWAESLLDWLNTASKRYRYWAALYDEVEPMHSVKVVMNYGWTKAQIKRRRDDELNLFLEHR